MFRLPDLPYAYDALEPHIGARTLEIHHSKHHAGYVDKLNRAIEKAPELEETSIERLLGDLAAIPSRVRTAVRDNGGGHLNHSLFWESMSADAGGAPEGELASRLDDEFGDFDAFRKEFTEAATSRFGSGWAWLALDGDRPVVLSTANQDNPVSAGLTPLLGLDVWEHAYYLEYQNRRPDYVKAWWNLVDWDTVSERFDAEVAVAVSV